MNARKLQQAVMEDLEALFSDRYFKTPNHTMATPKAYAQFLLPRDAQTGEDPFPFIEVRLRMGGIESPTDPHKATILLFIGIYDDGTKDFREKPPQDGEWDNRNYGAVAVMEIIERIQEHYEKHPALDHGNFYFDGPFSWEMQEEEFFPYYAGFCEMTFTLAAPRKERSEFV